MSEEKRQVMEGTRRYHVDVADVLDYLSSLPSDSVDLVVTSPPYGDARSYGIDFNKTGEKWVAWMKEVASHLSRVCTGLVAINCSGRTKQFSYDCIPELLTADLKRAGFTLRKGCIFYRWGIAGASPDFWRSNWENVICLTRPGRLPYSRPAETGKPPKYKPGGKMSHRTQNGEKVKAGDYHPPKVANPGNVIKMTYDAEQITKLIDDRVGGDITDSDLIKCVVGGGHMGSKLAHENEAPMPESLAYPFVVSFCKPSGLVLDPFCGSGTTGAVAIKAGRRFLGCDIRESQKELADRRLSSVNPPLFAE